MEITNIKVKKVHNKGQILGYASVQFDNCLVVHDIKLVQLDGKRILSFPNRRVTRYSTDSESCVESSMFIDIVHPSNSDFRRYVEDAIFKIYDTNEGGNN